LQSGYFILYLHYLIKTAMNIPQPKPLENNTSFLDIVRNDNENEPF